MSQINDSSKEGGSSPEGESPCWVTLRPPDYSHIAEIVVDNMGWHPAQMPPHIELNAERFNYLLKKWGIDCFIEISRLNQKQNEAPQVSTFNASGEATADKVKAYTKQKPAQTEDLSDKKIIRIDFDVLNFKASYQRDIFAQLIEETLYQELILLAFENLVDELKNDVLTMALAIVSYFISSGIFHGNEFQPDTFPIFLSYLIGLTLLGKYLIVSADLLHRGLHDEDFQRKLMSKLLKKQAWTDFDRDFNEDQFRKDEDTELKKMLFSKVFALPFSQSAQIIISLLKEKIQAGFSPSSLIRPTK